MQGAQNSKKYEGALYIIYWVWTAVYYSTLPVSSLTVHSQKMKHLQGVGRGYTI